MVATVAMKLEVGLTGRYNWVQAAQQQQPDGPLAAQFKRCNDCLRVCQSADSATVDAAVATMCVEFIHLGHIAPPCLVAREMRDALDWMVWMLCWWCGARGSSAHPPLSVAMTVQVLRGCGGQHIQALACSEARGADLARAMCGLGGPCVWPSV